MPIQYAWKHSRFICQGYGNANTELMQVKNLCRSLWSYPARLQFLAIICVSTSDLLTKAWVNIAKCKCRNSENALRDLHCYHCTVADKVVGVSLTKHESLMSTKVPPRVVNFPQSIQYAMQHLKLHYHFFKSQIQCMAPVHFPLWPSLSASISQHCQCVAAISKSSHTKPWLPMTNLFLCEHLVRCSK